MEGADARGRRYLLLASPLDAASTTLPVSAEMVRFVDWVAGEWAAVGGGPVEHVAGQPLPAPHGSGPGPPSLGTRSPWTARAWSRATGQAGFYTFLAGDSRRLRSRR